MIFRCPMSGQSEDQLLVQWWGAGGNTAASRAGPHPLEPVLLPQSEGSWASRGTPSPGHQAPPWHQPTGRPWGRPQRRLVRDNQGCWWALTPKTHWNQMIYKYFEWDSDLLRSEAPNCLWGIWPKALILALIPLSYHCFGSTSQVLPRLDDNLLKTLAAELLVAQTHFL